MDSNQIVKVKRLDKSVAKRLTQNQPEEKLEPIAGQLQQLEIEQKGQLSAVVYLESLAEPTKEESVCGSGWSVTELMNEFRER